MDQPLSPSGVIIRLVVATACGALIGLNREEKHRPAGLRTLMLVSLGAAAFNLTSLQTILTNPDSQSHPDPNRVLAGLVGGIGFLGAATVFKTSGFVKGITTAAALWATAAVGAACGMGHLSIALFTTLLVFGILRLGPLEIALFGRDSEEAAGPPQQPSPSERAAQEGQRFQP